MATRSFFLLCILSVIFICESKPFNFPLYKQCDPKWGKNEMGVNGNGERATICAEGCAMTSISMILNGVGIQVDNQSVTPAVLNVWLMNNHGYECLDGDCNNMDVIITEAVSRQGIKYWGPSKPPLQTMITNIQNGNAIYVAHVHNNHHFVLLTGWNADTNAFTANDPYYDTKEYAYDSMSAAMVFTVRQWVAPQNLSFGTYMQCDSTWGSNQMGSDGETICQVGCLMTSTTNALLAFNISVDGGIATPASFNNWLRKNNGYVNGTSNFEEASINTLAPGKVSWPADGMHSTNDLPLATVQKYISQNRVVIANVRNGTHFVIAVAYDLVSQDLRVHDSSFPTAYYNYNDIVGWRIFDM